MRVFTDQIGRQVKVTASPQRVVSLVPSQTELLYDLGLGERVVGITKFCVHPETWFRSKQRVGGTKTVDLDKVRALQPDLIIANKEENVAAQIEALCAIAPVWVSDVEHLDGALEMIAQIGLLCNMISSAQDISSRIRDQFITLTKAKPATVAYCIWREPWMWAAGKTFINDILELAGWTNVLNTAVRYPEFSLEAIASLEPEILMLSSEPFPFKEAHLIEVQEALPNTKVLFVDGELCSWYGSRLLHTPAYLAQLIEAVR